MGTRSQVDLIEEHAALIDQFRKKNGGISRSSAVRVILNDWFSSESVKLEPSIHEEIEKYAKADDRTVENMVGAILKRWLKKAKQTGLMPYTE